MPGYLSNRFRDFKVRQKLIVLHNLFFLVLTSSVYFTVFPLLEQRLEGARARETNLITEILLADGPVGLETASYEEGGAQALGISPEIEKWLADHPGRIHGEPRTDSIIYRKVGADRFRRANMPHEYYRQALRLVRWALFIVLGVTYALAVLLLEVVIMPLYVYRPLNAMLVADYASLAGERSKEMIGANDIPGDEIGQIMRSRNQTVAELRRREDQLEQALQRLEAQDRLVSLGMLSAGVAHELNTPLAVLQGSVEKLLETVDQPAAQDRLRRMHKVATRLRTISESLLDFARVRTRELGDVAVRALIDEAWSLIALDEKSSKVGFSNNVPEACKVRGNPDRLMQVFVNLLRNALHAAPEQDARISASADPYPGGWRIAIDDNGPGIPEGVLPDIFEAFITTRLDSRGTGLGLTVSEGIIHQHGGSITASNKSGGGARLEIRLPESTHAG